MDLALFHFFNGFVGKSLIIDATIVIFAEHIAYLLSAVFAVFVLLKIRRRTDRLVALLAGAVAPAIAYFIFRNGTHLIYQRIRPFTSLDVINLLHLDSPSFPSGHSSIFFALSGVAYSYNKKLGICFFAATLLMTAARVAAGVHYPSDILGGAVIGLLCAWLTIKFIAPRVRKAMNRHDE